MLLILLLLPLICAAVILPLKNRPRAIYTVSVLGAFATSITGLSAAGRVFSSGTLSGLNNSLYLDALGAFMVSIISIVGLLAAIYSVSYTSHEVKSGEVPERRLRWYFFWYFFFVFTMLGVVLANNLGIMWVAVEGTTLASALLVAYYDKHSSLEAAWKYIIICTVGIIFALFGIILLYIAAVNVLGEGSSTLDWTNLIKAAGQLDQKLVKLAFVFILVGYGTKVGFAPMHTWLPDAHSQAPSPVSAVLSGVLLNCALYAILRIHLVVSGAVGFGYSGNLLLIFGLLSVGISIPFILVQHDLKRLFAYSSVEHMGLIAAAVGIGGKLGLYGAFLHMLNHALTKSTLFFTAGNVSHKYKTKKIGRIKGVMRTMPITGPALLLSVFAIAGVPPFNIFLSEFTILSAAFGQGKYIPAGSILVFLTLIFAGMIFAVSKMAFGSEPGRVKRGEVSKLSAAILLLPLVLIGVLGIYIPSFIDNILGQVVKVMEGGL